MSFANFALPISSFSGFFMVKYDFSPDYIYMVGAALSFLNLIILFKFDDAPYVSLSKRKTITSLHKASLNESGMIRKSS